MQNIKSLARSYLRAYRLSQRVGEHLPTDLETAGKEMLELAANGERLRAEADLSRFIEEVWTPFISLLERRIKRGHKDLMQLVQMRLAISEFLHTLASERHRYDVAKKLGEEIEMLRGLLIEDFIEGVEDQEKP